MSAARYLVGDVFDVLATLEPGSVDCVITSPPYYKQRAYLPSDHGLKSFELGQEPTPGEYLESLLRVMDALWPVMTSDATFWVNLGDKHAGRRRRSERSATYQGKSERKTVRACNPEGVPPKNWWVVGTEPYPEAHYAVFPPSLVVRPVICGAPQGGTILDPFAGSGTTLAVATGHGRDAIGIDIDHRNAQLAVNRVGPLLLTVETPEATAC